jgi:hypothetical protein
MTPSELSHFAYNYSMADESSWGGSGGSSKPGFLRRRTSFLITVGVLVVATAVYYPFSPRGVQSRNMAKAEPHIPIVQRAIASDPRFANITFKPFTAEEGSLIVHGTVPTNKNLDELKAVVASTSPPRPVIYAVISEEEMEAAATRP